MRCPDCGRLVILIENPESFELDFYHLEDLEQYDPGFLDFSEDEENRVIDPLSVYDENEEVITDVMYHNIKRRAIPLSEGCSFKNRLDNMIKIKEVYILSNGTIRDFRLSDPDKYYK